MTPTTETSEYQLICWRDVPVQVRVRGGGQRHSHKLPERFQQAATRSAFRARAITGDAYLSAWTSSPWQPYAAGAAQALGEIVAQLEAAYPQARLDKLIMNKGHEEVTTHDS
jgi:hypothetical protein